MTTTTPESSGLLASQAAPRRAEPFRFFDNREKYLLFVTTTSEKSEVAARIGRELPYLRPTPPALYLFDAGTGNGTVLSQVLRQLHRELPTVPFVAAGKEISMEDARLTLNQLPDRLAEHPETVFVLTNMFYAEAPWLYPRSAANQAGLKWWDIALDGDSAHAFSEQIHQLDHVLTDGWQTTTSASSGNPIYEHPAVLVLYRRDRAFALDRIIPRNIGAPQDIAYDLVLAAQPYRSRTPAAAKVRTVLAPLARSLSPGGRLVVVQSTGHDPGMEIIRRIWPDEDPFATPRHLLITELERELNGSAGDHPPGFAFEGTSDARALFTYHLHAMPNEVGSRISTSTALAAWNAAVYVAQIEDERIASVLSSPRYLDATVEVVRKHGGLWFQDESFVVVRNDG
ncbi:MAG: hypothetical protein R2749_19980 [Acidimicrobiales bacterium]